jgi:hypothetical protein
VELEEKRGVYYCTVGRPNPPSYLFFHSYEVKVKGGEIQDISVHDNNGILRENRDFVVGENRKFGKLILGEIYFHIENSY